METFSALSALCVGNSPVTGQWCWALMLSLIYAWINGKQSWGWWFESPSCSLWGHCNESCTVTHLNSESGDYKANLRDLIAATGLVILLKLDWNGRFFARVTLKFDGWPRKIIRHVFYTTSSFVYHFRSISKIKLELQSENAQSGSNSMIFLAVWPCNLTYDLEKTIGHLFYATSSFVHHSVPIGMFRLELQSGNDQFGSNSTIFRAVRPWNLTDDLEKQ